MYRLVAATVIFFCFFVSSFGQEPITSPGNDDIRARVEQWIETLDETHQISGTLLIGRGDVVVYEQSFGKADYELSVPVTPSTRFNIASVSKPITQILLLSLMSEEDLERPISEWFPDVPAADTTTVRHLAEHRSGIPHRVTTTAEETEPQTAESMARLALRADRLFEPGSERSYSSAGYAVLSRVLELVGDAPYETLLRRYVTAPVGAMQTSHPAPLGLIRNRAQGYFHGTGPIPSPPRNLTFLIGGGSIFSNPHDLFLIQRGIVNGTYGPKIRDQLLGDNGFRWNGYTNGYRAFADYHAEHDLTVILTSNLFTGAGDLIRDTIPRIAAGEHVDPPAVPTIVAVPVDLRDQKQIEGPYSLGSTEQSLRFHSPTLASLGDWILVPIGEDRFFSPQDYATVHAVRDGEKVVALQWGEGPRFPRGEVEN